MQDIINFGKAAEANHMQEPPESPLAETPEQMPEPFEGPLPEAYPEPGPDHPTENEWPSTRLEKSRKKRKKAAVRDSEAEE